MSREGKLTKQIDEGGQAESLIKNPIFEKVFNTLEQEFLTAWKSSSVEDSAEREKLYYLFQALQALKTGILNVSANGRLAKSQLDEMVGRSKTIN